jgi:hypothetical protein
MVTVSKKRKSGVPTGNAGEYFVMGELLRKGFDAQLADRNTKGYDILVGRSKDKALRKVQVKSVRAAPWYVNMSQFKDDMLDMVTIYVLIGAESGEHPVQYFIAKNRDLAIHADAPATWKDYGFMSLKAVTPYENKWENLLGAPS